MPTIAAGCLVAYLIDLMMYGFKDEAAVPAVLCNQILKIMLPALPNSSPVATSFSRRRLRPGAKNRPVCSRQPKPWGSRPIRAHAALTLFLALPIVPIKKSKTYKKLRLKPDMGAIARADMR
jgi:hypothetical protein